MQQALNFIDSIGNDSAKNRYHLYLTLHLVEHIHPYMCTHMYRHLYEIFHPVDRMCSGQYVLSVDQVPATVSGST